MDPVSSQRRIVTAPTRLNSQRAASSHDNAPAQINESGETLFVHPLVKTVTFSASIVPASVDWGFAKGAGTVPWSTPNERVKAVGSLEIYRISTLGNACFIHTADLIINLTHRSQIWCVDGISRFGMRSRLSIYRFELPCDTEEDKARIEDFKNVLASILWFERGPCPFKRGFEQENAEELPSPLSRRGKGASKRARRWINNRNWRPEDDPDYDPQRPGSSGSQGESDSSVSDATEDGNHSEQDASHSQMPVRVEKTRPGVAARIKTFDDTSQVYQRNSHQPKPLPDTGQLSDAQVSHATVGPTSTLASTRQEHRAVPPALGTCAHERDESVATVTPATFGRPLTPPSATNAPIPREWSGTQEGPLTPPTSGLGQEKLYPLEPTSEDDAGTPDSIKADVDTLPLTPQSGPEVPASPLVAVPEGAEITQEVATTPSATTERIQREMARRRRTASPRTHQRFRSQDLPSYVLDDISSPTAVSKTSSSTLALTPINVLYKTAALMMGPPSGLVQIMVQIASRLRHAGSSNASVFSVKKMMRVMRGRGRELPGRWTSDSEDEGDLDDDVDDDDAILGSEDLRWEAGPNEDDEDDEDDFGVPLGVQTPARARRMDWGNGMQ